MGDFVLPPEAGLRSGSGHISHVILEIHYDNPHLHENVVDSMGFEAIYVNTPRANDAGILVAGDPIVRLGNDGMRPLPPYPIGELPVGQSHIHREASCPSECTSSFSQPITVYGHFLHMHQ